MSIYGRGGREGTITFLAQSYQFILKVSDLILYNQVVRDSSQFLLYNNPGHNTLKKVLSGPLGKTPMGIAGIQESKALFTGESK